MLLRHRRTPRPTVRSPEEEFEQLEDIDPSNFDDSANIDNEWWPLKPGTQLIYEGEPH